MTTVHFMNETGKTIKNYYNRTRLPVVGDSITLQTNTKGNFNYIVVSRKFVYKWKPARLCFVEIVLKKVS